MTRKTMSREALITDLEKKVAEAENSRQECVRLIAELDRLNTECENQLKKVQEGERKLEAIMRYVPDGIILADQDIVIRAASKFSRDLIDHRGEITRLPLPTILKDFDIFHPDGSRLEYNELPLVKAIKKGIIVKNEEMTLRRQDGFEVTLLVTAGPIYDEDGAIAGGITVWRDITAFKMARDEQERMNAEIMNALLRAQKVLGGMLKICAECRRVKDEKEGWITLKKFIKDHAEAEIVLSLCPECTRKIYGGQAA